MGKYIHSINIECLLGTGTFFIMRVCHRHKVPAVIELTFLGETDSGQINLYYVRVSKCSEEEKTMEGERKC